MSFLHTQFHAWKTESNWPVRLKPLALKTHWHLTSIIFTVKIYLTNPRILQQPSPWTSWLLALRSFEYRTLGDLDCPVSFFCLLLPNSPSLHQYILVCFHFLLPYFYCLSRRLSRVREWKRETAALWIPPFLEVYFKEDIDLGCIFCLLYFWKHPHSHNEIILPNTECRYECVYRGNDP